MSRRRLSDDERALWRGFARGVTPLRRGADAALGAAPDRATRETPPARSVSKQHAHAKQPPALARLDLHGMTQTKAHAALLRFLTQAQAEDAKLALVVTGKGIGGAAGSPSERGVLRRQVPLWLSLPEFRRFIVSFQEAHASHGGEGALYLRLRRRPR
jgi:DNA-nicking Smr family endonuclease